jgi:hypothetical protein
MSAAREETQKLDSAPALFLDKFEELRMELSDEQLIADAIEINHAGIGKDLTLERYRDHLIHHSHYLASAHGKTFHTAKSRQVRLFMGHLEKPGGTKPHASRALRVVQDEGLPGWPLGSGLLGVLPQEPPGGDQIPLPPLLGRG